MNFAHKYTIFMKGDTLDEMAEEALHFAYLYVMRALQERRIQGRNGEYEAFALELLAMLQSTGTCTPILPRHLRRFD